MKKISSNVLLTIIVIILCLSITVGYAVFNQDLGIIGSLSVKAIGKVEVTKVELDSGAGDGGADDGMLPSDTLYLDEKTGELKLKFNGSYSNTETTQQGTFLIHVENNTLFDYTYTGFSINHNVSISTGNSEDGLVEVTTTHDTSNSNNTLINGSKILPGEDGIIAVRVRIHAGSDQKVNITITGDANVSSSLENNGEIKASLDKESIDLSNGNNDNCFGINVINTYNYARSFQLSASGNFYLVDKNGNTLTDFHIGAPSENDSTSNISNYTVCLRVQEGSIFSTNTTSTTISLSTNEILPIVVGDISVTVDINNVEDNNKVEIANVNLSLGAYDTTTNSLPVYISWDRTDTGGSELKGYYFQWYDATDNNKLLGTYFAGNTLTSYTTNLSAADLEYYYEDMVTNNHQYYVKVYGEDAQNSGLEDCSSSEKNNYCVASPTISFKWKFNVDTSGLEYMSSSGETVAYLGNTYSTTLVPDDKYSLPSEIAITMSGNPLTLNTDYTYDSSSNGGAVNITKVVNGDITIGGKADKDGIACLVEGTKIKLANGKYKNIEDIRYDDLIMSYSYDLGKVVYEYPIWIEKENESDSYQKITFSDGAILKTVGEHGIYSVDERKYVSVMDRDRFHVGTKVIKFDENNNKQVVKVTKIEQVNELVKYYHVTANRYHNVLSNDILTTDAFLVVSNMFSFDENIMWTNEREEFLSTNDLFYYEDWAHMFARHLFAGYRMPETKYLYNQGLLDIEYGSWILDRLALDPEKSNNNKNLWMVTTSDDLRVGKKGIVLEEESVYILPNPIVKPGAKFLGWYNTSDNKYYQPGDKISVDYGLYFEAIWNL